MALITCKDCGKEYSSDAKSCIQCGANKADFPPAKKNREWLWAALFIFIGIPIIGSLTGTSPDAHDADERQHPEKYVLGACMDFTKRWLHDPSSADFDYPYPDEHALGDNQYEMVLGLRAKNGFGALRHFAVHCVVRFTGDSWFLVSMKDID